MTGFITKFENVWIADDDQDDCVFLENALKEVAPHIHLTIFNKAEDVLLVLTKKRPDLLFLDLNMPTVNGIECLKEIRADKAYRTIPIVVYSSSGNQHDINCSYGYGADLYLKKPTSLQGISSSIKVILGMDWNSPADITSKHFVNNQFMPFELPGEVI